MFTIDIKRAYKNFRVDPLDRPLMGIKWKGHTYMPFGVRSSFSKVGREGISSKMFLDDLIVVAPIKYVAEVQLQVDASLTGIRAMDQ